MRSIAITNIPIAMIIAPIITVSISNSELLEKKQNIDSTEFIEEIARDKLGMYLPNERVYIDISK